MSNFIIPSLAIIAYYEYLKQFCVNQVKSLLLMMAILLLSITIRLKCDV